MESQNDSGSDQGEPEEQLDKVDASDPSALDEKLWGDEEGPTDANKRDRKTDKDHSERKSTGSDIVAKEAPQSPARQNTKDQELPGEGNEVVEEQAIPEDPADEDGAGEEDLEAHGAPMDEHVQDANTLDLPDDMDLGVGDEHDAPGDEEGVEGGTEDGGEAEEDEGPYDDTESSCQATQDPVDDGQPPGREISQESQEQSVEGVAAHADLSSGGGSSEVKDISDSKAGETTGPAMEIQESIGQGPSPDEQLKQLDE